MNVIDKNFRNKETIKLKWLQLNYTIFWTLLRPSAWGVPGFSLNSAASGESREKISTQSLYTHTHTRTRTLTHTHAPLPPPDTHTPPFPRHAQGQKEHVGAVRGVYVTYTPFRLLFNIQNLKYLPNCTILNLNLKGHLSENLTAPTFLSVEQEPSKQVLRVYSPYTPSLPPPPPLTRIPNRQRCL